MFRFLTFSNGTNEQCIQIDIIDDSALENRESFTVNLDRIFNFGVIVDDFSVSVFIEDNESTSIACIICMMLVKVVTKSNEHTIYHLLVVFAIQLDDVSYEVSENIGDAHLALIVCFVPVTNTSNLTIAQGREVNIVAETQDGKAIGIPILTLKKQYYISTVTEYIGNNMVKFQVVKIISMHRPPSSLIMIHPSETT